MSSVLPMCFGLKTLKPTIARTFPFDQIVEAHRYLEGNQQLGKVVVTLPE